MIPLGQEQRLGRKAYSLLVWRKLTPALIILLIAVALLAADRAIAAAVVSMASAGGATASRAFQAGVGTTVQFVVLSAFVVGLVACLISILIARFEYSNYTFTFEEFDLRLKRGLLSTKVTSIPYRQMQDVNLERHLMHRLTGTARLVIHSAGHEEAADATAGSSDEDEIVLDPIAADLADDIRLELQRKIGVQVVEGEHEADTEATAATVVRPSGPTA